MSSMTRDPATSPAGGHPLSAIVSLRALLDVTRLIRRGEELSVVFDTIARTMADALGLGAVVINLYRPAWDDFEVASVHGAPEAREALLGTVNSGDTWAPLLDPRFERRGAYHIPAGQLEWHSVMPAWVPPETPNELDPGAWHPEDALFVPFVDANGEIAGIFSVDEPVSRRRPSDGELDVLVAFAEHAALAVQTAQEAVEAARHRDALGRLLEVSTRLTHASSTETLLQAVCDGIASALEFQRVAILLTGEDGDALSPVAWSGWAGDEPALAARYSLSGHGPLLVPRYEVEGCFLAPLEEVAELLPASQKIYRSVMNGVGPRAWRRHSLIVPLYGGAGETFGLIWVEDPADRLLPGGPRLQALRLFADQATTALASAAQLAEMTFLAEHDALTRLPNRRAFMRLLEELVADLRPFALAFVDIDGFKAVNDSHGHAAGDAALVSLAGTLAGSLRQTDQAFRIGGDEFALMLHGADAQAAAAIVRRIAATLAASIDGRLSALRASVGIAVFPDNAADADKLFRLADEAMYAATRSGDRLVFAA
jgi:diguanylate cyclase (GGDEF)-like protein